MRIGKIRRVMLILPPEYKPRDRPADVNFAPPLGIAYVAASLEKAGYEVRMLDAVIEGPQHEEEVTPKISRIGLPFEEIRDRLADFKPDVVGISSMFTMFRKNTHRLAATVKSLSPAPLVIVGGAHPTAAPDMVMEDPNVDYLVMAEGDNSIVPLLEAIERGGPLGALDGVAYRDEGRLVVHEKKDFITDLDSLPFPARHLLPMDKYIASGVYHGSYGLTGLRHLRPTSLITSRGCPYNCNFCTAHKVFSKRPRLRSVANVMAEIDHLVKTYGINFLSFEDDQFIVKSARTEEFLEALAAYRPRLSWDTPNGVSVWLLGDRIIGKMKAAGCLRVNMAVESGSQYVLDHIIDKPVRVDKVPEIVRSIRRHGMKANMFLVMGNISEEAVETFDQMREGFRLARRLRMSPHVSYLTPYPGSEVLDVALRKGYLVKDFDWDTLTIAEHHLNTPLWTAEELQRVVERERALTDLWFKIANTREWLGRFLPILQHRLLESPVKLVVYYARRTLQEARKFISWAIDWVLRRT